MEFPQIKNVMRHLDTFQHVCEGPALETDPTICCVPLRIGPPTKHIDQEKNKPYVENWERKSVLSIYKAAWKSVWLLQLAVRNRSKLTISLSLRLLSCIQTLSRCPRSGERISCLGKCGEGAGADEECGQGEN